MTTRFIVKEGTAGLTPAQTVERGRMHAAAILAAPLVFVNPVPLPAAIKTKCDEVELADIAVTENGGKKDYLLRKERLKELRSMIKDLAGYVQAISDGDPEIIALAAFGTRKLPQPSELPKAAGNLRVTFTTKPGELKVRWAGQRNKLIYELEMAEGDPLVTANFQLLTMTGKNFHLVAGLTSHKDYSFRVAVVGAAGVGPYSDIATGKPL